MATENLYLVLDPAEIVFKKLQAEVNKKVIVWNRNPTAYAHQLDVAQKFLARGTASRLKSEEEYATTKKLKNKAQDEIAHTRDSVVDAMQKQKDAEKTAQIEIANANIRFRCQRKPNGNMRVGRVLRPRFILVRT